MASNWRLERAFKKMMPIFKNLDVLDPKQILLLTRNPNLQTPYFSYSSHKKFFVFTWISIGPFYGCVGATASAIESNGRQDDESTEFVLLGLKSCLSCIGQKLRHLSCSLSGGWVSRDLGLVPISMIPDLGTMEMEPRGSTSGIGTSSPSHRPSIARRRSKSEQY